MTDSRFVGLKARLASYEPCDDREAGNLAAMLTLLATGGDPLSRFHFDPGHFTASGFVVSSDRSTLLLVHHTKLDKWLQPGGHIEPDDADLLGAAMREVAEETGLGDLELLGLLDLDVHVFPKRGNEPAHDHLDVRFGFRSFSSEAIAGDGTAEVAWFSLSEVAKWTDRPSLARPARKLLAPSS